MTLLCNLHCVYSPITDFFVFFRIHFPGLDFCIFKQVEERTVYSCLAPCLEFGNSLNFFACDPLTLSRFFIRWKV